MREIFLPPGIGEGLAVVAAAGLLLAPAVYNGYPLVFYDTVDYLRMSFDGDAAIYRTVPYGVWLAALHRGASLWLPVVAQALVLAWMMRQVLAAFTPDRADGRLIGLGLALTLLTGLPYYAGQIMPDALAGVVPLGMAVLAFAPNRLETARTLGVAGLTVIAGAVHSSHMLNAVGIGLALPLIRLAAAKWWPEFRPACGLPLAAASASVAAVLVVHWVYLGWPHLNGAGPVFFFARLVQDGIAQRYLAEVCPAPEVINLCAVREDLPNLANDFLWGHEPAFDRLGGFAGLDREATNAIMGALLHFPLLNLIHAAKDFVLQLALIDTGEGLWDQGNLLDEVMRERLPGERSALQNAVQQRGAIGFDGLNRIQVPVTLVADLALLVLLAQAWRQRERRAAGLAAVMVLGLLGNAAICGILSNPTGRYQGRIAWTALVVLACRGPGTGYRIGSSSWKSALGSSISISHRSGS